MSDPRVEVARRLPDRRQLLAQDVRGGTAFLLPRPGKGHAQVGRYDATERLLVKRVRVDTHAYRKRPGIGVNLELVAWLAAKARPQPKALRVITERTAYDVPWEVVCRFALAAFDGHPGHLITDDLDAQALIPWEALGGTRSGPLPPPPPKPPAPPTLFEV